MDNNLFAQWESFTKSAIDSGKELEALNLKLVEELSEQQMALMTSAMEVGNKWFSSFSEYKALPEMLAAQSKLASDYSNKLISVSKAATDVLSASREGYTGWFEKNVKLLSEQAAAASIKPAPVRKAA